MPVAGAAACEAFVGYLGEMGRGHRILPERVRLDLGLEQDELDDLIEVALQVGLVERAPQVRCPRCQARLDLEALLAGRADAGAATCDTCDDTIASPERLAQEMRYRLNDEADAEVASAQADRNAMPTLRVAILTALPVELAAVRAHLELGEDLSRETVAGGQIHLTASLAGAHVNWDIACAISEQTNSAAAAALVNALNAFKPDLAIFVGVAGGIERNGAALGDVVAATRVIAYEGGKDTDEGLRPRPVDFGTSYDLRQIALHMLVDEHWQARILAASAGAPPFEAHVEPIAAGSKVVASASSATAKLIEQVAPRAVAVEMEGAGFLEALSRFGGVSGIVIRGISDLLDGKAVTDRAGWQQQASANAAAFAFELLYRFQPPPA